MNYTNRNRQILTAAVKAAETKGYRRFTRADVVFEAGVSGGLIQHHFNTMDGLRTAVRYEAIRTENLRILSQIAGLGPPWTDEVPSSLWEKTFRYLKTVIQGTG